MKCYKAHLKKEFADKYNVFSPIIIDEKQLDLLINGEMVTITIISTDLQISFNLYYSDLTMITTCE